MYNPRKRHSSSESHAVWESLRLQTNPARARSPRVHLKLDLISTGGSGSKQGEVDMKTPIAIILTMLVLVVAGGALAAMNNACKSSHHSWCAPHYERAASHED